jgi:hypothetical protein
VVTALLPSARFVSSCCFDMATYLDRQYNTSRCHSYLPQSFTHPSTAAVVHHRAARPTQHRVHKRPLCPKQPGRAGSPPSRVPLTDMHHPAAASSQQPAAPHQSEQGPQHNRMHPSSQVALALSALITKHTIVLLQTASRCNGP